MPITLKSLKVRLAVVSALIFLFPLTSLARRGTYSPSTPQRTEYNSELERERAQPKEAAAKARQERINQLVDRIKAATMCIRDTSQAIREYQQQRQNALNEMVEEGSGIHTTPQYMEKPPKMYDHIPTADEVQRDLSPSARFEHSRSNISRLQRELEACRKELKKAQEELRMLKE